MSTNTIWSPRSPNIPNGQIKIANPPEGTSRNNIQTDWTRLNPNSANPAVNNLEYRVNNLNVVEFRYPTTNDPNGPKSTATSIQEIADDRLYVAAYGYTPTTTQLIQDSLRKELTSQAESIGWASTPTRPSPVTAPRPPQGDQQGGGASTPANGTSGGTPESSVLPGPSQPLDTNPTISNPREILSIPTSGIRYPLRMSDDQDKIKFIACEIEKKTGLDGEPVYTPKNGPIFLAIQSPISDQNSVDWGPDSVNPIDAELFNLAKTVITPGEPFGKATEDQIKSMYNKLMMSSDRFQTYLAGQAASVNNAVARIDRAILNPNLELLFQGPQLRPFSFQFKMTAREPDEAVAIKKIIKYFKYHMAVRKENNNLFLRAPYVFTIQYLKGMEPKHPGINLISPEDNKKACALTNCSVDYTPLGTYMTNIDDPDPEKNGTMVAYTLSLQFQEITPVYDTDYKDYENHPIGF